MLIFGFWALVFHRYLALIFIQNGNFEQFSEINENSISQIQLLTVIYTVILTYTTRILADAQERIGLLDTLEAERTAFNICSQEHFRANKHSITELHAKCYYKIRELHPNIPSQVVIKAEQACLAAYRSIKSSKRKLLAAPMKKKLSLQLDKRIYTFKDNVFSITTLGKRVKVKFYIYAKLAELLESCEFHDPKIFVKNGELWIAFPFEIPDTEHKETLACGVDLGIRRFAATSEGKIFIDRNCNSRRRKIRHLKRHLQAKRTKSAKRHLKRIRRKERNQNKNFVNHLANAVIQSTKANVLVLEDLTGLKKKKHKYQNKNRISQIAFYELKQILSYKAKAHGKTVKIVSPCFTSQIDSVSNKREGERKGCRFYAKSGLIYDADVNAGVNIAHRSKLPVSQGNLLDGQATVTTPIVGR